MDNSKEKVEILEKIANSVIAWIGSISSLIVHSLLFIISFALPIFNLVPFDKMLLVLTTIVSLEAIYLAIFIQMSVNKSSQKIEDIQEDIDDIQEDIEEISDDIDEIQEDIEEINDDDDDEDDSNEKAKNVMLKSTVSLNSNQIKSLKKTIEDLQHQIEILKEK